MYENHQNGMDVVYQEVPKTHPKKVTVSKTTPQVSKSSKKRNTTAKKQTVQTAETQQADDTS